MSEHSPTPKISLNFSLPPNISSTPENISSYLSQQIIGLQCDTPVFSPETHTWNIPVKINEGFAESLIKTLNSLENTLNKYMIIAEHQSKELKQKVESDTEKKKRELEKEIEEKKAFLEQLNEAIRATEKEKEDIMSDTTMNSTDISKISNIP